MRPASKNTEMRVQWDVILIAAACVWAVGTGCAAKKPAEETPIASTDRACTHDPSDPLHMSAGPTDTKGDPEIEKILAQPTSDWRLTQINRWMYQSLHALDVELRREQRLAACEHPVLDARSDSAPTSSDGGTAAGGSGLSGSIAGAASASVGVGGGGNGGVSSAATSSSAPGAASVSAQSAMAGGVARTTALRNTGRTASGGGGNGATAPKITPGSDNDIVARRLRKAAEQEPNPTLRAKLWKEYTDYARGTSAK